MVALVKSRPATLPFVNILPGTRSNPNRSYKYTQHDAALGCPCSGTLAITDNTSHAEYGVTEFYPDKGFGGRAFELRCTKDGQKVYHCRLDGPGSTCDCKGFTYEGTKKANNRELLAGGCSSVYHESLGCRHLDALADLLAEGQLPDPRACQEADAARGSEVPEVEVTDEDRRRWHEAFVAEEESMPDCFKGLGGRPLSDYPF